MLHCQLGMISPNCINQSSTLYVPISGAIILNRSLYVVNLTSCDQNNVSSSLITFQNFAHRSFDAAHDTSFIWASLHFVLIRNGISDPGTGTLVR